MKSNIYYFETNKAVSKLEVLDKIGTRGRQAMDMAGLGLPIVPGIILDADFSMSFDPSQIAAQIQSHLGSFETKTAKKFSATEKPLLLKVVVSPNLQLSYPSIHNLGLTKATLPGFSAFTGSKFALGELHFLLDGMLKLEKKIAESKDDTQLVESIDKKIKDVSTSELKVKSAKDVSSFSVDSILKLASPYIPAEIFDDAWQQLVHVLVRIRELLTIESSLSGLDASNDTAIIIQPMVYGNFGKNSSSGKFFTRNVITGEKTLEGNFYQEQFNEEGGQATDINKLEKKHLDVLQKTADLVEKFYKQIRELRFTIEDGTLWVIDQRVVNEKSTRADIRLLLDLLKIKSVDEKFIVKSVKPSQLNELLHPVIDPTSVKGLQKMVGGIAGAPGAAIGRVYFSTESLINAYRQAQKDNTDTRLIFCQEATFADDVKAVELATGVLSSHGGYAAHASVVARQYGKVSLVLDDTQIKYMGKKAIIGGVTVNEGDYLSFNVPFYGNPVIYFGVAKTIQSDIESSGLSEFVQIAKKMLKNFSVRANADTEEGAKLALALGADGIGLCRTEHMFFNEKRINVFREMIMAKDKPSRLKILDKLKKFQKEDFYKILKIMSGKPVIIRLLDPPLHEFLPHNEQEAKKFYEYLNPEGKKTSEKGPTLKEIMAKAEALHEFNPMLGHRGSRLAVTYPEIYAMQVEAIVEATVQLQSEGIECDPEIMLPVIMSENELKLLVYGKRIEGGSFKGLVEVIDETLTRLKVVKLPILKIGTMIEIPAAALGAGKLSKYAQFFSFGTNDLSQTTLGLSRDDFNSFMPDYTQLDIMTGNPFKDLDPQVMELIQVAVQRGKLTRPDLECGLCGEHGAVPENITFCRAVGLNYVSCSPFSVPIAILAAAQDCLAD
jgi:pyruvate,orthophosphate dikinase